MRRIALLWIFLALVITVLPASASSAPADQQSQPSDFVPGEVLVKFKPGTPGQVVADTHRQNGIQVKETIPGIDVQVLQVPAGRESGMVATYAHNPNVLFAELNGFYYVDWMPNDQYVGQQWQYENTNDADIDAFEAWDLARGSSSVKIAILDTGIDQDHPDLPLMTKVIDGPNYSSSSTVDDLYGHGTHVAGSAAAMTDNTIGVAGTCPDCSLLNVKVLGDDGSGSWSGIANGIGWATDNGANVISMSLGGSFGSSTLQTAVDYAWNHGVVVVAAAGNDHRSRPSYPAYYSNAIAVAATDSNDAKASYSNYGSWVDVAAPGSSILSTAPNHANAIWGSGVSYGIISGTSMATPHVAGLAGLIWSTNLCSQKDNACVRNLIESRADEIPGTGTYWTYGRINAYNSVSSSGAPTNQPPAADDQSVTTAEDTPVSITLTASDPDNDQLTYSIDTGPANGTLSDVTGASVTYTPDKGYTGTDSFTFTASDGEATSNVATVTITVNGSSVDLTPVHVQGVTYSTPNSKQLEVGVLLNDDQDKPVPGASVSAQLYRNGRAFKSFADTTEANGVVTFTLGNAPKGTYTTTITDVSGTDLTWDGSTPPNSYTKE